MRLTCFARPANLPRHRRLPSNKTKPKVPARRHDAVVYLPSVLARRGHDMLAELLNFPIRCRTQ
jgi:hypothetical protein